MLIDASVSEASRNKWAQAWKLSHEWDEDGKGKGTDEGQGKDKGRQHKKTDAKN